MIDASPRDRRREATLERIVEAALELVREHGLPGLTMQRLADAVDYTPGALYRYFSGKGALVADLNRRVLEQARQAVEAAVEAVGSPDSEAAHLAVLLASSRALLDEARRQPAAFAVVAATLGDPTRLVSTEEAVHLPVLLQFLGEVAGRVEAATAAGALNPAPAQARALRWVFGIVGILQLGKMAPLDARLDPWPLATDLTLDLLRGWGASPAALQQAHHLLEESS